MQVAVPMTQTTGTKQTTQTTRSPENEEARELAGSEILCEALVREGVELLYGYPGGAIMPFYDALTSYPSLHHVLVRHEQAASHAADASGHSNGARAADKAVDRIAVVGENQWILVSSDDSARAGEYWNLDRMLKAKPMPLPDSKDGTR